MNIKKDFRNNHRWDPIHDWWTNFLNHRNEMRSEKLCEDIDVWIGNGFWEGKNGLHCWRDSAKLDTGRFNILCDFESRNNHEAWEDKFDRILTLDADVVEWRNNLLGEQKYVYVYTPVSNGWFEQSDVKQRDVIVCGTIYSKYLQTYMVDPLADFDNMWVGDGRGVFRDGITRELQGQGYPEKMRLISKSKVSVCWNAVPFSYGTIKQMMDRPKLLDNPTNRDLGFLRNPNDTWPKEFCKLFNDGNDDDNMKYLKPQLKTRAFEAAACKTLILTCYDDFRHIETWFNEGEDFVYFEPGKLGEKLKEVLDNFESYKNMVDNAHNKAKQLYKTSNFWNDFIVVNP